MRYINLEYHPMDSRITIADDDVCQTLNQRMGTGGGNVPIILEIRDEQESDSKPVVIKNEEDEQSDPDH